MSYAPCKNPNCGSYGTPHPNCRCYGEHAEGGEVAFCSSARMHDKDCQYFAEGGETFDPDKIVMDEPAAEPTQEFDPDKIVMDEPSEETEQEFDPDKIVMDEPDTGSPDSDDHNADLDPAALQAKMVEAANPGEPSKYETAGQQLATVAEGASRGLAGEAATLAENKLLGIPLEDIRGREKANPGKALTAEAAGLVGGLMTGTGEAALTAKAAQALAKYSMLGKVGSGVLTGMLSNGVITATDEVSKALLGENPEHPVAAVLASMGLGSVLGGIGGKASSVVSNKLEKRLEGKAGTKISSWLAGIGSAANPEHDGLNKKVFDSIDKEKFSQEAFEAGRKFFGELMGKANKASKPVTIGAAATYGYAEGGLPGAVKKATEAYLLGKAGGLGIKGLDKTLKWVGAPTVLKILSSNSTAGILEALDHAEKVAKGLHAIDVGVEGLFTGASRASAGAVNKREDIENWMDAGGNDHEIQQAIYGQGQEVPQGFAKGGDVKPTPNQESGVATHFPEQDLIMHAAKARASSYLNRLRPSQHQAKLAFDDPPDDRKQKKDYKRAVNVAANPLSVLDEIRKGTIDPDDIKHLSSMFPEVVSLLQKKVTERVVKSQMEGKKPNYKVRQGLSMLLATPLSGELTPQNIAAAQSVFASKAQQAQASGGGSPQTKKGTQSLTKSDRSYLTDDQAREQRQQRQA